LHIRALIVPIVRDAIRVKLVLDLPCVPI